MDAHGYALEFGNMFSAAGATLYLPFVRVPPSRILLNSLRYDVSEMTVTADDVDAAQLARPA
jgi:Mg2+-importing ATPase